MKLNFTVYKIADISTIHITEKDGELIGRKDAPFRIGEVDSIIPGGGSPGVFFYVPKNNLGCPKADCDDIEERLAAFGFSHAFVEIMQSLRKQGIPYVRFDCDGAIIDNTQHFEW